MKYDLIIIGSGSVGAAAGYYATRAGLNVLMTCLLYTSDAADE